MTDSANMPGTVEMLTPLDAHVLKVAPFGDATQAYEALQLTLGDEAGALRDVTIEADHALKLVELILNRLHNAGHPRATEIVEILQTRYGSKTITYRRAA